MNLEALDPDDLRDQAVRLELGAVTLYALADELEASRVGDLLSPQPHLPEAPDNKAKGREEIRTTFLIKETSNMDAVLRHARMEKAQGRTVYFKYPDGREVEWTSD